MALNCASFGRITILLGGMLSASSLAQPQAQLAAVSLLESGQWQIRELDTPDVAPRSICVSDPNMLMQLRHSTKNCSRFVVTNDARRATIRYTCPANGFGQTTLRVETARLAKIDTQGIADNMPFAFRAEARRIGPCDPKKSARR